MLSSVVRSVCAVALLVLSTTPAVAQTPERIIRFTFSAPVTIPGVTLPAGTYMFRLADPSYGRSLVQVRSDDGKKIYSTFVTIPRQAPQAPENPEIRFMERRSDMPFAISAWWYPGETTGFEPIYPRKQAELLAKRVNEPVLTEDGKNLARIDQNGEETIVE